MKIMFFLMILMLNGCAIGEYSQVQIANNCDMKMQNEKELENEL